MAIFSFCLQENPVNSVHTVRQPVSRHSCTLRSNAPVWNHFHQRKESALGRKRSLSQSQSGAVRTTVSDPSSPPPYSLLPAVRLFHTVAEREVTRPGQWAITAFPQPMHHSKGGSLETRTDCQFSRGAKSKNLKCAGFLFYCGRGAESILPL